MNIKKILVGAAASALMLGAVITPAFADTVNVNFETPTYTVGDINAQDSWMKTGPFDVAVVTNTYGFTSFNGQSLRISDSITSGSFGDQTFAKPLTDAVGETGATAGSFSVGTRQTHFETQFDIASTQSTEQSGMHVSVSPDRGDGSRMSYLRFDDATTGINVFFDDVTGITSPVSFNETQIGTSLDRTVTHTIKLTFDAVEGASNDVVRVWIDGTLVHTGTSWENYYRFDNEASAEHSPRIVKTVLFRESGDAHSENASKGFLIDNLSLFSGPSTVTVTIDKYIDSSMATATSANSSAFPMSATWNATNIGAGSGNYDLDADGFNGNPTPYQAITSNMTTGADYTTNEVTGGSVVGASCTTGQPYALVGYTTGNTLSEAQEGSPISTIPNFTNLQSNKYVIVWNMTCPVTTPTPNPYAIPAECSGIEGLGAPIIGTDKSEVINGTSGNDLIFALGGSDVVNGKGGNDCIVGGAGSDVLRGDGGNDVLLGGDGSDALYGGIGNDKLYGGAGSDLLKGEAGNDTIDGQAGNDAANGGNGTDVCTAEFVTQCNP